MLIKINDVSKILTDNNIEIRGILHVGAHECEEKEAYNTVLGVKDDNIIWVDANEDLIEKNKASGIPNCFTAALDRTAHEATFYLTNNGQSSSLLEFGLHSKYHPHVKVTNQRTVHTETLSNFFNRISMDPSKFNIWNFDIQGSELDVFKGSPDMLKFADLIYTEVNTAQVYKKCGELTEMDEFLATHGFKRVQTNMTQFKWGDAVYIRV